MTRGMVEPEKKKNSAKKTFKTLGKVMAGFLAAGVALIAVTDKTMSKAFPQDEECEGEADAEGQGEDVE